MWEPLLAERARLLLPGVLPALLFLGCGSVRPLLADRPGERVSEQVWSRPGVESASIMGADEQGPAGPVESRILLVSAHPRL
jgi:hypothetical protein